MSNAPEKLTIVNTMTADQLRSWDEQIKNLVHWQGIPLLPNGFEIQIIALCPDRVEPDIMDEP